MKTGSQRLCLDAYAIKVKSHHRQHFLRGGEAKETAICRRWQNEAIALRGNGGIVNALTDPEIREMVPDPGKGEPMKSPSRILMK